MKRTTGLRELKKITFVIEEFAPRTPAQQLLDRFLIGYPRDGEFHRLNQCQVSVHFAGEGEKGELEQRTKDFGLIQETDLRRAVSDADGTVLIWKGAGAVANPTLLREVLRNSAAKSACFVYGSLGTTSAEANNSLKLASSCGVTLLAGTYAGVTIRLPDIDLPRRTRLQEALIIVQGPAQAAELHALDGLLPVVEKRRGAESGVRDVRFMQGAELWRARERGEWSWPLLAAAISRSDTPQGDPVADGRTQDLAGLGLIPKLARDPRGWLIEHRDGLRSTILVLDGVVADFNVAVQARDGRIFSAQLYRPPAPGEHHFSRLAAVIEDFFRTGKAPWSVKRAILIAGLLENFTKIRNA